jgi:hypothetical protein
MSDTTTPAGAGLELTKKGERYAARHANKSYFAKISKIRRAAIREIDRLIDLVDRIDGDPDLEDNGDAEPTLGWSVNGQPGAGTFTDGDGEMEHSLGWTVSGHLGDNGPETNDRELDKADDEPSLGSSACFGFFGYGYWRGYDASPEWSQEHWAAGRRDDIENDPADPPPGVGLGDLEGD